MFDSVICYEPGYSLLSFVTTWENQNRTKYQARLNILCRLVEEKEHSMYPCLEKLSSIDRPPWRWIRLWAPFQEQAFLRSQDTIKIILNQSNNIYTWKKEYKLYFKWFHFNDLPSFIMQGFQPQKKILHA